MARYSAKLRYYPGDALNEIRPEDLARIAGRCHVEISFARIDNRTASGEMLREETLDRPLEEISQDVVTVASDDEEKFREALAAIYGEYRSPRTPYSFSGSTADAERIAKAVADCSGGW